MGQSPAEGDEVQPPTINLLDTDKRIWLPLHGYYVRSCAGRCVDDRRNRPAPYRPQGRAQEHICDRDWRIRCDWRFQYWSDNEHQPHFSKDVRTWRTRNYYSRDYC